MVSCPELFRKFYSLFFLLLLGGLFACSTGEDEPVVAPPEEAPSPAYLVEVTHRLLCDRQAFAARLELDPTNPLLSLLPDKEIKIESILYRTEDPLGDAVDASGIVAYPADGELKGVVVSHHYSIGADRESPSYTMSSIESALALFGYLVITPDYLGFGSTRDLPQTYLHAESAGRTSVDMLFAVREYMDSIGTAISHRPVSVAGYSQGAFSALAFTRRVEQEYAGQISLSRLFAGGGPYVPASMFDLFIEQEEIANPSTVLLTVIGLDYAARLNLDYTRVFREPLLSNYRDWCVTKHYTLGQINHLLGTKKLSDFMHPDLFTSTMNPELRKIMTALEENDLTQWSPRVPILLVHGTKDQTVPYLNAEKAYQSFTAAGATVNLISVNADHSETALSFYLALLQQLAF